MFKRELMPAFFVVRRIHVLCFWRNKVLNAFSEHEVSVPSIVHLAYFQLNHQRISDLIPKIFSLFRQTSSQWNTHIYSDPNLKNIKILLYY